MVAADVNRLKLFGDADRIDRMNKILSRPPFLLVLNQNAGEPTLCQKINIRPTNSRRFKRKLTEKFNTG
jgi:hypothetical protein